MKRVKNSKANVSFRIAFLMGVLLLGFVVVLSEAFGIQVQGHKFYQDKADRQYIRKKKIPVSRGIIYDRNGDVLALSVAMASVGVNPKKILDQESEIDRLAEALDMDVDQLQEDLLRFKKRTFVFVKRFITPAMVDKIEALAIKGVSFETEFKRFYPSSEVLANVIGFTNIDDQGQEGLELFYNDSLKGKEGMKTVLQALVKNRTIEDVDELEKAVPGMDLHLTIDRRLQYMAYFALKKAVKQNLAESGSAVVLDVKTGEILALVNQPSFNPNANRENKKAFRNRALTDIFEPGSVMKPFTIVAALESGKYQPGSTVDTTPGKLKLGGYFINDFRNYGVLDLAGVLIKSSNVGVAKIVLTLEEGHVWDVYQRFGFGAVAGSLLKGQSPGKLKHYSRWQKTDFASLSRGYHLGVTVIQLAAAYSVFANNGRYRPPTILKTEIGEDRAVIDPKVAKQMREMLTRVVADVPQHKAKVPNYKIAGKTGTAKVAQNKTYAEDKYEASFAGFAPASNPRLVVVVNIKNPRGEFYYGGQVAAPVFAEIMENALRLLNIPADDLPKNSANVLGQQHKPSLEADNG